MTNAAAGGGDPVALMTATRTRTDGATTTTVLRRGPAGLEVVDAGGQVRPAGVEDVAAAVAAEPDLNESRHGEVLEVTLHQDSGLTVPQFADLVRVVDVDNLDEDFDDWVVDNDIVYSLEDDVGSVFALRAVQVNGVSCGVAALDDDPSTAVAVPLEQRWSWWPEFLEYWASYTASQIASMTSGSFTDEIGLVTPTVVCHTVKHDEVEEGVRLYRYDPAAKVDVLADWLGSVEEVFSAWPFVTMALDGETVSDMDAMPVWGEEAYGLEVTLTLNLSAEEKAALRAWMDANLGTRD